MARLFRSLLFVPGNNPRFIEKAMSVPADMICFDLEDSVPHAEKQRARELVAEALGRRAQYAASIFVRTNSPASGMIPDDLRAAVRAGLDGIVIPKADGAAEIKGIENSMTHLEGERGTGRLEIIPSIESARGVINCYEIASCASRVSAVVFGVFDLLNDMGVEYTKQSAAAAYARAKIPLDAAAAGVVSIDAIWQDVGDAGGLEGDCHAGRDLGYTGKSLIHPSQIPATHRAFHPNAAEIGWARKVAREYPVSAGMGRGATTIDGKMIDEVHYKRAIALLELADGMPAGSEGEPVP